MNELLATRDAELLVLTLNRPDKGNAINEAVNSALVAQLELAASDEAVRGAILAAVGTRTFSAGADLREFAELDPATASRRRRALLVRTLGVLLDFGKPLVAALQAKALGAGAMLAMLADEVVAAETAQLGMPEIRHGMPSPIGLVLIQARGGPAVARKLLQNGEPIDARRALALHLVDDVVPMEDVLTRATERARALAAYPGAAFRANKQFMNRALRAALQEAAAEAERLQEAAQRA